MWDATKAVLRQKFVALNICIRKEKSSEIYDLSYHLKKQEKEDQIKTKVSGGKEIIKIREEINEIENRKVRKTWIKARTCYWEDQYN